MRIRTWIAAAILVVMGAPALSVAQDFEQAEFTVQDIASGIAVMSGAGGNIALHTGPDGALLVDSDYQQMAGKLLTSLAAHDVSAVRYLINTHWHVDHVGGNDELAKGGAVIIAHEQAHARMKTGGKVLGNVIAPLAPDALPVVTFADQLRIRANGDELDLIYTGAGHTDGDIVVYWRKANVLHTGDLMMNGLGLPFIDRDSGGDAGRLVASLDQLVNLTNAQTIIIPGHGPVTQQADLILWRDRVKAAVNAVQHLSAQGKDEAAIATDPAVQMLAGQGGFITAEKFVASVLADDGLAD